MAISRRYESSRPFAGVRRIPKGPNTTRRIGCRQANMAKCARFMDHHRKQHSGHGACPIRIGKQGKNQKKIKLHIDFRIFKPKSH
jgi:hypothetical protein